MVRSSMPNLQKLRELGKSVFIRVGALPFVLVAILVIFGAWNPVFLSLGNIVSVSRASTYLVVVTMAQMLVLLSAGLDLSVGGSITLISIISASVMVALKAYPGVDMLVGALAGIGIGTLVGALNGFAIAFFRISPFVVTFATGSMAHGMALIITEGGVPIFGLPAYFMSILGGGKVLGIPVPVIVTIVLIGVVHLVLSWTRFGRGIYAMGGSRQAAGIMGIPVRRNTFLVYVIAGLLVGIAGVMLTARIGSGEPTIGLEMPLLSITAAVMGGISLFGGEGRLYGAVLGAIALTLLRVGMDLAMIGSFEQMAAMGAVLIMVTALDGYRRRLV